MRRLGLLLLLILIESCAAQNSCGTKRACTKAGKKNGVVASCQPKTEDCDGRLLRSKKFCKDPNSCSCCVPPPPPIDCGKPKPSCEKLGTTFGVTTYCLPKKERDNCAGKIRGGKKYCKNPKKCGCCVPDKACNNLNGTCGPLSMGICREACHTTEDIDDICDGERCFCCLERACHNLGNACGPQDLGECRESSCRLNEEAHGPCPGSDCTCCVEKACHDSGKRCGPSDSGSCRESCLPTEEPAGICDGASCTCCVEKEDANCYINGVEYISGQYQFTDNCMDFTCFYGKWATVGLYRPLCSECRLSNDPHITTFDGAKYDWHGDCTYVVAQEVDGQNNVVSYVHNKFTKCGSASCVDTVYFKPRVGPLITVLKQYSASPTSAQVVINGYSQSITTSGREMQVLEGPEHVEHPVLAYWLDNCLHIIAVDTQDFLVKVCSYFIKIFAPRMNLSQRTVSGMCGSPNDGSPNDDLRLRDGTVVVNPNGWGWNNVVDPAFADDWQVPTGTCGAGRRKRSTDEEVDKEPCKASESQRAEYIRICQESIRNDVSLSQDLRNDFIDGCAFDRCIITQNGADAVTVQEWLNEWTEVIEHEVFEQKHHENISVVCNPKCLNGECTAPNTCKCNPGWTGNICQTPVCIPICRNGACTGPNKCTCNPGWTGNICQTPVCKLECINGACTAPNTCKCKSGWTGNICQTPVCKPECINGACTTPNTCKCNSGWTGNICQTPVCKLECINGACTAPNTCKCNSGWTGNICHTPVCKPECINGACTTPTTCKCNSGWTGNLCQTPVCKPECINGACTAPTTCKCNSGWTGNICQTRICAGSCTTKGQRGLCSTDCFPNARLKTEHRMSILPVGPVGPKPTLGPIGPIGPGPITLGPPILTCSLPCTCCPIIQVCDGTCTTIQGSGTCKNTCSSGEEHIGSCSGGSCSCCRRKIIPSCQGICNVNGEVGTCSSNCFISPMLKLVPIGPGATFGPFPSSCSFGCTCCPFTARP